ncbi:MAG: hypothetical protein HY360_22270 [Verrucomicrobia bacterium]|nr:hypothetical protein [Verrucomicrobiota bacterium]
MKTILTINLLTFSMWVAEINRGYAAENLVVNGGFEKITADFPDGWGTYTEDVKKAASPDNRTCYSGNYALNIKGDPSNNWMPVFSNSIQVNGGEDVTFGGFSKNNGKEGDSLFSLLEVDGNGKSIRHNEIRPQLNSDWNYYTKTLTLSAETRTIAVYLVPRSLRGEVWFDDVFVAKGKVEIKPPENQVKKISADKSTGGAETPDLRPDQELVVNGDFEAVNAEAPFGWKFKKEGRGMAFALADSGPGFGSRCASQIHSQFGLGSYSHITSEEPIKITPKCFYRLSGWLKTSENGRSSWTTIPSERGKRLEGVCLQIEWMNDSNQLIKSDWSKTVQTGGKWERAVLNASAPASAQYARIVVCHGDFEGTSYVDNVSLKALPEGWDNVEDWDVSDTNLNENGVPWNFEISGVENGAVKLVKESGKNIFTFSADKKGLGHLTLKFPTVDCSFPGTFSIRGDGKLNRLEQMPSLLFRVEYYDVNNQLLNKEEKTLKKKAPMEGAIAFSETVTPPSETAWFKAGLLFQGKGGSFTLRNIRCARIFKITLRDFGRLDEGSGAWQAEWIWYPEDPAVDCLNSHRYFRYDLNLPNPVEYARMLVTADNAYDLYVNSQKVGTGGRWATPGEYDIKSHLVVGKNVIAIKTFNIEGPAGLLAEGVVHLADGTTLTIKTDPSWKSTKGEDGNWLKTDADISGWKEALSLGRAPVPPWGAIHHPNLRKATKLQAKSNITLVPDGTVEIKLSFEENAVGPCLKKNGGRLAFRLGQVMLWETDVKMQVSENEKTGQASASIKLPDYFPKGRYDLVLRSGDAIISRPDAKDDSIGSFENPVEELRGFPKVTIRPLNNTPTAYINGKPHTLLHHWFTRFDKRVAANCRQINIMPAMNTGDMGWQAPNEYDYQRFDETVYQYLAENPDGYFFINADVTACDLGALTKFPKYPFWTEINPKELYQSEESGGKIKDYGGAWKSFPSFGSEKWRNDTGEALRQLIRHIKAQPYASHVAGFCISPYEWFHWRWMDADVDVSEPMAAGFRKWLEKKYKDEGRIREAWHDPTVTRSGITVPLKKEREHAVAGLFRDPQKHARVIDFYIYYSEVIADSLLRFAKAVKEETDGRSLCFAFYGYALHLADGNAGLHSGHHALRKILDSPDFDMLASPTDGYIFERAIGGTGGFMAPPNTFTLHGKLFCSQPDLRTHWSPQDVERTNTLKDDVHIFRRELSMDVTSNVEIEFLDFGAGYTMGEPRLVKELGRFKPIYDFSHGFDRRPRNADFAVIVDELSPAYMGKIPSSLEGHFLYHQRPLFFRTGAAHRYYLLSDLERKDFPDFKCLVFVNCFHLSDAQRKMLKQRYMKNGRTLVFVYAPGYVQENLSVDNISSLLGVSVKMLPDPVQLAVKIDGERLGTTPMESTGIVYGCANGEVAPTFYVDDPSAMVLGRLVKSDKASLIYKDCGDWKLVYSAAPMLPPRLLRDIVKSAGCHIYLESDDALYATTNFIGIHAHSGGVKKINLPVEGDVYDLFKRAVLFRKVKQFSVDLDRNETGFYFVGDGRKAESFFKNRIHEREPVNIHP